MPRKNTTDAFNAWKDGQSCRKSKTIWTEGNIIYSYTTPIVVKENGQIKFNGTRYSVTTSCQQNSLRYLLEKNGLDYQEVEL